MASYLGACLMASYLGAGLMASYLGAGLPASYLGAYFAGQAAYVGAGEFLIVGYSFGFLITVGF